MRLYDLPYDSVKLAKIEPGQSIGRYCYVRIIDVEREREA